MHRAFATRSLFAGLTLAGLVAACSSNNAGPSATVASLAVSVMPSPVPAGAAANVGVVAKDAAGNVVASYGGTVHFTSTDPAAQLPPNYTFVSTDAGSHTFAVTFQTAGTQTVSVTDVATSSVTGSQTIRVTPAQLLYVANLYGNTVTVYAAGATGNASPSNTITLPSGAGGPSNPFGVARDAAGQLYVAGGNSILIYAAGATGNAPPTATIAGSNTGLSGPRGIALDAAGQLYVANSACSPPPCGSVTVYASGATGNATPTRTIAGSNTALDVPDGIALDGSGRVYVSNVLSNSITVYAAGATGNASPTNTIAGSNTGLSQPAGIAFDATSRLYVANNTTSSITVYAAGATGNAAPATTLSGANTALGAPIGIAFDAVGQLHVANSSSNCVTIYAAGATGNASPTVIIVGTNTGLNGPTYLTF